MVSGGQYPTGDVRYGEYEYLMNKQEEIREGIEKLIGDTRYNEDKYLCDDISFMIMVYLAKEGVVIKVDRELPDCLYDSLIFPTTTEEAGKFLTNKGLTDREKSAVSGTIARLGWESCARVMDEAGYHATIPLVAE